jgi:hypothetical protein
MKHIIFITIFFVTLFPSLAIGQEWVRDTLFRIREKHSSNRQFNKYCKYQYILCKNILPSAPSPVTQRSLLRKMFFIPKSVRLKMYPFTEYDSISISLTISNTKIVLDNSLKLKLSNIMFNYSYKEWTIEYHNFVSYTNEIEYTISFYNTINSSHKYINFHYSGLYDTNFTDFELSQLDLDRTKIEFFIEKLNIK